MKFEVAKEIFDKLPNACFGVVMARGVDNTKSCAEIDDLLAESIAAATKRFEGTKVKEQADIVPYREAFRALGINPSRYACSVEALFKRIAKGKGMPHINPVVDLGNAISLKYTLPIGAHDLGGSKENMRIRFAEPEDTFLPFGSDTEEAPEEGEAIYAVGHQVRTRRWTWRQSEHGKITEESTDIFFPIDGFTDVNKEAVLEARDLLASMVKKIWNCEVTVGFIDREHPETEF